MENNLRFALAVVLVLVVVAEYASSMPLCLADDGRGNESLLLSMRGGAYGRPSAFLIDTAFAGAPVLSLSYAAALKDNPSLARRSLREQNRRVAGLPRPSETQMDEAFRGLIGVNRARAFTSGCTMRLSSIGAISESNSDMLLAPALRTGWRNHGGDVFVTNELHGSVNILTSDFLFHHQPVVLQPRRGRIRFRASRWHAIGFRFLPVTLVAGAPSVHVVVGGRSLQLVVDTGSGACVSVNPNVDFQHQKTNQRVFQNGVNGERVCSAVLSADCVLADHRLQDVQVMQNNKAVMHADGYIGLGVLRAFDLYISHSVIGLRRNGLSVKKNQNTADGSCT